MVDRINLADPDFEPTGAQLQALSTRAFAGVRAAHELSLERLRADIAREREKVLRWLDDTATDRQEPRP